MGQAVEIKVPNIGDFEDVEIIDVLVKAGDIVAVEDPLLTLESDKASMDVPSTHAGKVVEVKVAVGDRVSEGSVILLLEPEEEDSGDASEGDEEPEPASGREAEQVTAPAEEEPSPPEEAEEKPSASAPKKTQEEASPEGRRPSPTATVEAPAKTAPPHASPSVRRFARELGVNLGKLSGSGPRGRILREDVQGFVKQSLAAESPRTTAGPSPMPEIDFSRFGPVEDLPMSRINQLTGAAMSRSWTSIPHVTQLHDADVTDLEAFRKRLAAEQGDDGPRISLLPFIMKAVVAALKVHTRFNTSLDPSGKKLVQKGYFNIGVAVDTPEGLVVPVIRQVDRKGVVELAAELSEVSARARSRKLKTADVEGGCFTISNIGGIGGRHFTPIINPPEVGILGVSRAVTTPVWSKEEFAPRLMLPLSLSYDHRVIDGAIGARFVVTVADLLSDARRMLL